MKLEELEELAKRNENQLQQLLTLLKIENYTLDDLLNRTASVHISVENRIKLTAIDIKTKKRNQIYLVGTKHFKQMDEDEKDFFLYLLNTFKNLFNQYKHLQLAKDLESEVEGSMDKILEGSKTIHIV